MELAYAVNGPRYSADVDFWAEFNLARYGWAVVEDGVRLPEQFVANFLIDEVRLVEMKIVVRNGKPECRALKVMVKDDQPPLSGPQLRVPIEKFVTHACNAIAFMESTKAKWQSEEYRSEAVGAIKKVRQKRPMTDELLRQVAEIHQAADLGNKINAIMAEVHVADSTARLYVSEARKRKDPQTGETFLPPSTRRKAART
jgi:hypothetical protein